MKKFMYAALAVVAVLLFASCKNDKNQPKNEAGDAYVSFTFNLPQDGTRAGVDDKTAGQEYEGTAEEQAIKAVRVVLYDPASGAAKYAFDYSITGTGSAAPTGNDVVTGATAAKFTTKAKEVVSQDYLMLAIINPSAKVKTATDEGKTLREAQTAITTTVDELSGTGILMSNEQGLVKVAPANMKDAADAAEQNPVSVSVDRILAKVFVGGEAKVPTGAKFSNIKWQLNTTNKKTFIYRQFGQVATTTVNVFKIETAGDQSKRFDRYAQDPNFSGAFVAADFEYLVGTPKLKGTFGYDDAKGQYCLENTMEANSQIVQQTTSFILSGTWTPANHTQDGITFTEGNTWFSYQGFTFTETEMKKYIAEANDEAKKDKAEINGTPVGFKAALKKLLEMNDCPVKVADGTITKSFVAYDIKGYYKGVCYYQTNLIRHFNDSQSNAAMGYGRYGVVRNNIYKINVKSISQPGEPTVVNDKDNPGKDDPSKVFVSFDVTINPWIVRTQDISL